SRRRHTRSYGDWSSDVCSSDLMAAVGVVHEGFALEAVIEHRLDVVLGVRDPRELIVKVVLVLCRPVRERARRSSIIVQTRDFIRSEEHTSELQSPYDLVCRLLL